MTNAPLLLAAPSGPDDWVPYVQRSGKSSGSALIRSDTDQVARGTAICDAPLPSIAVVPAGGHIEEAQYIDGPETADAASNDLLLRVHITRYEKRASCKVVDFIDRDVPTTVAK